MNKQVSKYFVLNELISEFISLLNSYSMYFQGNPVFKKITHDCQYLFEWRTDLICKESYEDELGTACQIKFEAAKTNINLKPLQRPGGYSVNFGDKEYKINVCAAACNNQSGVCTTDGDSYGMSHKSELKWDYDALKLTYYGGSPCNGSLSGHKTTSIYFECEMNAGYGEPVAHESMQVLHKCMAIFTWKTNITCIEGIYNPEADTDSTPVTVKPTTNASVTNNSAANQSSDADSQKTPEEAPHHSMTSTVLASVLVVSGVVFVIVLVLFKSQRGQRVVASARRLFGIRGYNNIGLHTENSTLLGTTSSTRVFRVDDSDDDLLRV